MELSLKGHTVYISISPLTGMVDVRVDDDDD